MESTIFVSGIAIWFVIAALMILAVGFIALGCGYIKNEGKNESLRMENRSLKSELSLCQAELNVCKLKMQQYPRK